MPSDKRLRLLLTVDKTLFLACFAAFLFMFFGSTMGEVETEKSLIAGGVFLCLLFLWVFVQQQIAEKLKLLNTQLQIGSSDIFIALYEQSPLPYLTIKTDGKIVECNGSAARLLRGDMEEVKGKNFFKLIGLSENETDEEAAVVAAKVKNGLIITDQEMPIRTIVGGTVWALISIFADRGKGNRLVSLVDVTEKKVVDTAKSEFVALATHQLRTPIAAIRWNVELLQKKLGDAVTDDQLRYLSKIDRNVIRMIVLINDFLSVSKLEMGTYAAKSEEINLTDYISGVLDEYAEKIAEKQIQVDRQEHPTQLVVSIDSRLVHIILSNLISNAVKYTKNNGKIDLFYVEKQGTLQLRVIDDGIGIPENEIDNLFTKFYRASNAQTQHTEGTGLGLYAVQQSAERLGGKIEVKSAEERGAEFIVTLPVKVLGRADIG